MTPKTPFKYARAPVCLGYALLLLAGCCGEKASSVGDSSQVQTVATGLINASECGCAARELTFARAALGASPCETIVDSEGKIDSVKSELESTAKTNGAEFRVIDVEEAARLAKDAVPDSGFYALLVNREGHFFGLRGSIDVDGKRFYQVSHGAFGLQLLPQEFMIGANFQEAWLCRHEREGVAVPMGDATLVVDKTWQNFGEVAPLAGLKTSFHFQNLSERAVALGKPQTTCGCVVPSMDDTVAILPGESYDMEVSLQSGTATSFDQRVLMKCWDTETSKSCEFALELFGNRRETMTIQPRVLNFGSIREGKSATRTLSLLETETDRFQVTDVRCEDSSVKWEQSRKEIGDNLFRYDFLFTVEPGKTTGKIDGQIEIATTSNQYPVVKIPIEYVAVPAFSIVPKVLAFGAVAVGESKTLSVKLDPPTSADTSVSVLSLPHEVLFEREGDSFHVTFSPNQKGLWEGEIELELLEDNYKHVQTIECVANVR